MRYYIAVCHQVPNISKVLTLLLVPSHLLLLATVQPQIDVVNAVTHSRPILVQAKASEAGRFTRSQAVGPAIRRHLTAVPPVPAVTPV